MATWTPPKSVPVRRSRVKPGDIAHHVDGLDPRRVTRVEGDQIWIFLITDDHGPLPKANYTFTRWIDG